VVVTRFVTRKVLVSIYVYISALSNSRRFRPPGIAFAVRVRGLFGLYAFGGDLCRYGLAGAEVVRRSCGGRRRLRFCSGRGEGGFVVGEVIFFAVKASASEPESVWMALPWLRLEHDPPLVAQGVKLATQGVQALLELDVRLEALQRARAEVAWRAVVDLRDEVREDRVATEGQLRGFECLFEPVGVARVRVADSHAPALADGNG